MATLLYHPKNQLLFFTPQFYLEPATKLREALDAAGISHDRFMIFKHGETRLITDSETSNTTDTDKDATTTQL